MFRTPGSRAKLGARLPSNLVSFVSGTTMLFYQAAAPLGWTKLTSQDNKALRVVSGTGGVAGGTNAFSTVMAQTTVGNTSLSIAQLASHNHSYTSTNATCIGTGICGTVNVRFQAVGATTGSTGSGSTHNHTITMDIQYIDIILASKN